MKRISPVTEYDLKLPKGGMELTILSVAILIVLFFSLHSFKDTEEGLPVNRPTYFPKGPQLAIEDLRIIEIDVEGKIHLYNEVYSVEEFYDYLAQNPIEKDKVYLLRIEREAVFQNFISVKDTLNRSGIENKQIILGGIVSDDDH